MLHLYFRREAVLEQVENWIDATNLKYSSQKVSYDKFSNEFDGFYPTEFLKTHITLL